MITKLVTHYEYFARIMKLVTKLVMLQCTERSAWAACRMKERSLAPYGLLGFLKPPTRNLTRTH